jgi:hypothetical protein
METNAIAESVNAKIKEAIRKNNGSRDLDFFHFRLGMIIQPQHLKIKLTP